ncbi:MAG: hypothetical protein ACXV8O_19840 [Methylobacter sp.]
MVSKKTQKNVAIIKLHVVTHPATEIPAFAGLCVGVEEATEGWLEVSSIRNKNSGLIQIAEIEL